MRKEAASKLEKVLEKLLTSKLKGLNTPENFDRVKIDIYPSQYGINCHISYLMNGLNKLECLPHTNLSTLV
jgi:hypothetical protein